MRFIVEFMSRKNQHGVRRQNDALLTALTAVEALLREERAAHQATREQLQAALEARVEQRHRSVETRGALKVLQGGQARFPLPATNHKSLAPYFNGAERAHKELS